MLNEKIISTKAEIWGGDKYTRKGTELSKLETKIETNLSNHKKTLSFFENNDTCNTCTQPIDKVFKQQKINSEANKIS